MKIISFTRHEAGHFDASGIRCDGTEIERSPVLVAALERGLHRCLLAAQLRAASPLREAGLMARPAITLTGDQCREVETLAALLNQEQIADC